MDFFNKVSQVLINKYSSIFFEFFSSILIVRGLGLYDYGKYNVAYLIPTLIGSIGSIGLGPSIIYHINKKDIKILDLIFGVLVQIIKSNYF